MPGYCPNHGPYDGPACPYDPPHGNVLERPQNPPPLDEEPTDIGQQRGGYVDSEAPTEIPGGRRPDLEEEEPTDYGRSARMDVTELEAPPTVTLAMLWVKEGRRRGETYPIGNGTIVGRKEGDLILNDPKVSSMHAKFKLEGNDFVVWDFGSANGTYVNGRQIREATVLEENDLVKIGDTVFVVKLLDPRQKRKVTASAPARKAPARKKVAPAKPVKKPAKK